MKTNITKPLKSLIMKTVLSLILLFIVNVSIAQDFTKTDSEEEKQTTESTIKVNPRKDHRMGVNLNVGGPTVLLSLSTDYFITPCINIEAGIGLFGYYGGIKYHIGGKNLEKNWTPYIGIYRTTNTFFGLFGYKDVGTYIPIGIQHIRSNGFSFGVEAAGLFINGNETNTPPPIWGAIKLGYHF